MGRKRKREKKGDDDYHSVGINRLPDDVIIMILSRLMSRNEAARTSVLSRRWRYLWLQSSSPGTLELDDRTMSSSSNNIARIKLALESHKDRSLDGLVIRFSHLGSSLCGGHIDEWIYFVMQNRVEIKTLELDLLFHRFPSADMLFSRLHGGADHHDNFDFGFGSLRSLKLVNVEIEDEVVEYFVVSCPHLEHLCIRSSHVTRYLRVVDPFPSLRVLEISDCSNIELLEICATNLVSCTYQGKKIDFSVKKIQNLSELTLGGEFAQFFIYQPSNHSGYSAQLAKLALNVQSKPYYLRHWRNSVWSLDSLKHLELNVESSLGQSLHFFTSMIQASPLLIDFTIKISYSGADRSEVGFPNEDTTPNWCRHTNLKTVKMSGYVGCKTQDKFVLRILKMAPLLETVTVDTESEYYTHRTQKAGAKTRDEARKRAEQLKFKFPTKTALKIE